MIQVLHRVRDGGGEGIFGDEDKNELQTPVHTDAFNSAPTNLVVAPGDEAKFESSTPSITSSSSSSIPSANNTPSQSEPRCSSRIPVPMRASLENTAYEKREELAQAAGEDWAVNHPTANAASAEVDDTYKPKTYNEAMSLDAKR